jgi:hypothetical protein
MRALMMTMAGPLMLAGCSGSYTPAPLTPRQMTELDKALEGKVRGEKVSCINQLPRTDMRVISESVILYRVSKNLVYRNDLIGRCPGLTRGDALVVRTFGSQYCRGDIAQSANLTIGTLTGSCALGDFTPYRTPGR